MLDEVNEFLENQQETSKAITSLAQYTSVDALRSITSNLVYKRNKTYFILRATNALYTNDRDELKHGYDFLITTLQQIEANIDSGSNCPESLYLSNYAKELSFSKKYQDISHEKIMEWFYSGIRTPYFISLTRKVDDLTMWNKSYGRNGEGVCIVLDFSKMEYQNTELIINAPMMIAYTQSVGYYQTTTTLMETIFKAYNSYLRGVRNIEKEDILDLKLQTIESMCAFISSYFKGKQWHDEQEWRIMCTTIKEHATCIKYDNNDRPYVEVSIPLSCLKKIILGPKVDNSIVHEFKGNARLLGLSPEDVMKSEEPLK